jgi:ubiquinone/menaquinone biosynthesis C-methylase UbiE
MGIRPGGIAMGGEIRHEDEYNDTVIAMLELVWGEGFLSPGGPEAVREVLEGLDLKDKLVLDIGCGLGGIDVLLARDYGARVIGLDIEEGVVQRARKRVNDAGLRDRIEIRAYQPGPLPLEDASVDTVFGKDSWIHVQDKQSFFAEAFRVLKPGGSLAGGDWTKGPGPYSKDMEYFFEMEGLTYHMDTLENYSALLSEAGFADVELEDISDWYRGRAHQEYEAIRETLKPRMLEVLGEQSWSHYLENWRALTVVLDNGELRPGRFRARKPE